MTSQLNPIIYHFLSIVKNVTSIHSKLSPSSLQARDVAPGACIGKGCGLLFFSSHSLPLESGGHYGLLLGHFLHLPLGPGSPGILAQSGRKRKCLIYWLLLCDGFLMYKLARLNYILQLFNQTLI